MSPGEQAVGQQVYQLLREIAIGIGVVALLVAVGLVVRVAMRILEKIYD